MAESAFGMQLRQFRQAAGMSLRQLAAKVDYDHSYLSQVERGLRPGSTHLAQICDRALGTSPVLALAYAQTVQLKQPALQVEAPVLRKVAVGTGGGDLPEEVGRDDEWRAVVAAYARDFAVTPLADLLPDLGAELQLLRTSTFLGPGDMRSADSRRMAESVAGLGVLMSLTLTGLGRARTAGRWWRTARMAADSSGDRGVGSLVRGWEVRSGVVERRGHVELSGIAEEGFGLAEEPGQLARVLAGRAEVMAAMGDAVGAQRAVEGLLVVVGELPVGSSSVFKCSQREVFGAVGGVWATLGEPAAAYEVLDRALGLCPAEALRERAELELSVARCLMLEGDVAAGLAVAMRVLVELPDQWHTHPLYDAAGQVLGAVRGDAVGSPAVREYRELLRRRPFENRSVGSGSRYDWAEG